MRTLLGILVALAALPGAVAAQVAFPEIPQLTVVVEPPERVRDGAWVQGQILVRIQVASRHPFESLAVDMPRPEGAETVEVLKPRVRTVESYAGHGHVYEQAVAVFPQSSGALVIAGVRAAGTVGISGREVAFDHRSHDIEIAVAGIDRSYGDAWWMVSPQVEVSETWSKPLEELRVGDIVRREVTVTALGVPARWISIPGHRRTDGIQVSDAGTTMRTRTSARGVLGTRTRSWDIRIERGGVIYIAPISIRSWNPDTAGIRRGGAPGHRIEPLPPDRAALVAGLMREARERREADRTLLAVIAAGVAVAVAVPLLLLLWQVLPTRADRALRSAAHMAQSGPELYRALLAWSAASGIAVADAGSEAERITRAAFAPGGDAPPGADGAAGLVRLARARRLRATLDSWAVLWRVLAGPTYRL
ncbi:MAG: hypothetical protein OXE86_05720 [Alphaproteobacteria bacterium]|nr:hypothetical protein [Alphaproteobacteria bacterium]